jgi:AcrR family transcriptional regulator
MHLAAFDGDVLAGAESTLDAAERDLDLALDDLDSLLVIGVPVGGNPAARGDLHIGDGARSARLARGLDEGGQLAGNRVVNGSNRHGCSSISTLYYIESMQLGQRTKSEPHGTARRILDHARRAFNERGVASVGIREIARDLELSPGNVSYHYPTKEALILALVEAAHAENNAAVAAPRERLDFPSVDAIVREIMRRDLENQWFMRDCVGLLVAFPVLRSRYEQMHRAREERVDGMARRLIAAGLLDRSRTEPALPLLRRQLITQVAFWLPSAILAAPDRDPAKSLDAYARAALALFLAYSTPTGRRQLEAALG